MPKTKKPRPKSQREIVDIALGSETYDPASVSRSFPDISNRGNDISTKGDRSKDISIGLIDIDTSIIKYIESKVKPSITQDGNRIQVPIMYGYPERWTTIQEKGYLREYSGRFIAPVIVLKRDSIEANRTLGTKIDANRPQNIYAFETTYTKKNQYDNFSALTNRIPVKEYKLVVMPEYITLKYSAVVFTNHLEQNNKIIEALQYAANTYWGEEGKFQFRANIGSFATSTEYSVGQDRTTRTNFDITLNGYIIPDTVNRDISHPKKFISKSQIIFNLETDVTDIFTVGSSPANTVKNQAVNFPTPPNPTVEGTVDPAILIYLNTNKTKVADIVTAPNLATFTGASFLQPPAGSGLPDTDKSSFSYFINGQYVPLTAITSFDGINLVFNTTVLGYNLESDDEVTATGKFT
jgi:hypothetical protein